MAVAALQSSEKQKAQCGRSAESDRQQQKAEQEQNQPPAPQFTAPALSISGLTRLYSVPPFSLFRFDESI
jgi:hypothetical protein